MTQYLEKLKQIRNPRTTNLNVLDMEYLPDWQALTGKVPGTTQVELMFDASGTADILELCLRRSHPGNRPAAIVALRRSDELRWLARQSDMGKDIRPTPIVNGFGKLNPSIRHAYVILSGDTPAETSLLVPTNIETLTIIELRLDQKIVLLPARVKKAISVTRTPKPGTPDQYQWTLSDVIAKQQETLTSEQMSRKAA